MWKNDINGIIKEVKRLMVICQFRVLRDIKWKGYRLLWNNDKLNCKLNKGEGLKRKNRKIKPKHLKTIVFWGKGVLFLALGV